MVITFIRKMDPSISIELVPRELQQFIDEALLVKEKFPQFSMINIPDINWLPISSLMGCKLLREQNFSNILIPHIAAGKISEGNYCKITQTIDEQGLKKVLIIRGDKKEANSFTSLELIQRLRNDYKESLEIFAALDPYRSCQETELEYAREKLLKGATGFFTQPFFDIEKAKSYQRYLFDCQVFWGISPVLTEKSYDYWRIRNKVVFPESFSLSLEANAIFAREMLKVLNKAEHSFYFMPIKVNIKEYLEAVFD